MGVNIFSTYNGTRYAIESGTSVDAPDMEGAAALYKAIDATPDKVMAEIAAINTQPDTLCDGGSSGYFTDILRCKKPLLPQSLVSP